MKRPVNRGIWMESMERRTLMSGADFQYIDTTFDAGAGDRDATAPHERFTPATPPPKPPKETASAADDVDSAMAAGLAALERLLGGRSTQSDQEVWS